LRGSDEVVKVPYRCETVPLVRRVKGSEKVTATDLCFEDDDQAFWDWLRVWIMREDFVFRNFDIC
jgi:hypothetical protein